MNRLKLNELYPQRLYKGLKRRIISLPYKYSWSFGLEGKKERKRLELFYNLHKGQRCYLIANGPSLSDIDLSFLQNNISIGLNRLYLLYEKYNFKNDYLVSINKLVLNQFQDDFNRLDVIKFLNWETKQLFDNNSFNFFIYKSFFGKKFGKKINKSINPAATVTYAALQIAYFLGFKEVIIIGLDHNFTTNKKNKPNLEEVIKTEDINHFSKDYFPKGSKWETPDLQSSEYYYKLADRQFRLDNRRIIDCTKNGKCDIFSKGNLEEWI